MKSIGPAVRAAVFACALIAVPAAALAQQCKGGWAGSVEYTRSQSSSNTKTVERVSRKGSDTTSWSMTYNYAAQVSLRATPDPDVSLARADISLSSVSTESTSAKDQEICLHSRTPRAVSGSFSTKSETAANENNLEAEVDVSMDGDGTYSVGVRLPEVKATVSGSSTSSFSGQCVPKKGTSESISGAPITVEGFQFSSSGEDRISATDPDRLAGSHTVTMYGVTETLSWNLQRCGGALTLVDLRFEDMRFPNWEAWQRIGRSKSTTDGNIIRITATLINGSAEEKSGTVKFRDTYKGGHPDGLLEELSATVPPGEKREVSFLWDSSGYAWFDDGRPRLAQPIKAELIESSKKTGELTASLKVAPKPVVLVHGLWSNWTAWQQWEKILRNGHSNEWKAYPVGREPEFGRMSTGEYPGNTAPTNTIAENSNELRRYIEHAQTERNAWHIDIVAHSMGGLISRHYIHRHMPAGGNKPRVAHLVMLGTPNMGSRCADILSVPLTEMGRRMEALRELRPSVVAQFNAVHIARKGVEFSIMAGNPIPASCYMYTANDGVVTVPSAYWKIEDREERSVIHINMATQEIFDAFVKRRLAIGPAKYKEIFDAEANAVDAAEGEPAYNPPVTPDFSKLVPVPAGQTVKVEIPVKDAKTLGLTFAAVEKVSATLRDDKGTIVASNLTDTPEAGQMFRSMLVERPVAAGTWTLTLENTDEVEREVVLGTWSMPR